MQPYHDLISEHFINPPKHPRSINSHSPSFPSLQPLASSIYRDRSDLYKQNRRICMWTLVMHLYYSAWCFQSSFTPFHLYVPLAFLRPSPRLYGCNISIHFAAHAHWGSPHFRPIRNKAVTNIHADIFAWTCVFNSLEIGNRIAESRIAGSYGRSVLNFLRNYHTVSQTGCLIFPTSDIRTSSFLHAFENACYWPSFWLGPSSWI